MFGRKFQWLIVGMYDEDWWSVDRGSPVNCTQTEMASAVKGVILMEMLPLSSDEDITISKLVP